MSLAQVRDLPKLEIKSPLFIRNSQGLFLGTATSLRNGGERYLRYPPRGCLTAYPLSSPSFHAGPLGLLLGYAFVGSITFTVMVCLHSESRVFGGTHSNHFKDFTWRNDSVPSYSWRSHYHGGTLRFQRVQFSSRLDLLVQLDRRITR